MMLPQGPEGPQGEAGKSAFEYWKEYFGQPNATIKDFLDAIKGEKGDKGDTPEFKVSIGEDNTWYINDKSTGVKATGANGKNGLNGKDGVSPVFDVKIGENGNWFINNTDTGKPSKGKDGVTQKIEIRSDGYWYINGVKSVKAEGIDGKDGDAGKVPTISISEDGFWVIDGVITTTSALAPKVHIGANGNWYINGIDTGKPSKGSDGKTPVVVIGTNGNWFINGTDTGKPSKGNDGQTPVVNIGANGNWYINGIDTGKPSKGNDGKTPVVSIGDNGNWFINGSDTNKPSKGKDGLSGKTPVITIGSNGNWFIDGVDSKTLALGKNGKDGEDAEFSLSINDKGFWVINGVVTTQLAHGKSSYTIWKEAVDAGEMTNKDGSKYKGGNTESDYYKWLQGGDISTLYLYWRDDATGINKDKTMDDFIKELFDCHCDGLSLSVSYASACFVVSTEGELLDVGSVSASLNVSGQAGTKLTLRKGDNIITSAVVESEEKDVVFTIKQTLKEQIFTLDCELPAKKGQVARTVTKTFVIEPIQYVAGVKAKVENISDDTQKVIVTKPYADVLLSVGEENVDEDKSWEKLADGLSYSKIFSKGASAKFLHIIAATKEGLCSSTSVVIDQLEPVVITKYEMKVFDDCQSELVVTGTHGMTVKVIWHKDGNERVLNESPAGTYSVLLPRAYGSIKYDVIASKEGFGDIKKSFKTTTDQYLINPIVVERKNYDTAHNGSLNCTHFQFEIKNPTANDVKVGLYAFKNDNNRAKRHYPSWLSDSNGKYILENEEITIPAKGAVLLNMYRDVAEDYSEGGFYARFTTASQCGVQFNLDLYVLNQRDFKYGFSRPKDGSGSGNGSGNGSGDGPVFDPVTGKYTINAFVEDGFPETPVQIFLAKDVRGSEVIAYHGFAYKSTNVDGYAALTFEMTKEEFELALGRAGYIQFNLPNQRTYKRDVILKFD